MTADRERYLVGAYTPPDGDAAGVALLERDGDNWSTHPGAAVASPSFLARHPTLPVVYAVAEHRAELVLLDLAADGTTRVLHDGIPAGPAACHVRVAADGGSVVVACWGDGAVIRYTLDGEGRVVDARHGTIPGPGSRAHASIAIPGGFATTDLGLDLLRIWSDTGGALVETQRLQLPHGTGPRHLVAHPSGRLYVDTEHSVEILTLEHGEHGWEVVGRSPARPGGRLDGDTAAEIALDPTGRWLTVGVRGSDVIATSRIGGDGTTEPWSETPSGGTRPRHHLHDAHGVLVANQSSSTVVRIPFDADAGTFGAAAESVPVPSPTFLLAL